MADPYGRAIRDRLTSRQDGPLLERYGEEVRDHAETMDEVYFSDFDTTHPDNEWIASWVDGPMLDIGAGTGRHTLYFQDMFEAVAIEVSGHLVEVMRRRGVDDARQVDMFDVREAFERDRFSSVLMIGTQLGLTTSMEGLRRFLGDLSFVTRPDAAAVLDSYDPRRAMEYDVPGFRSDPTRGDAHRVLQFEYAGDLGEPLLFRFFSPERLEEATLGTGWEIDEIRSHPSGPDDVVQYRAALTKR